MDGRCAGNFGLQSIRGGVRVCVLHRGRCWQSKTHDRPCWNVSTSSWFEVESRYIRQHSAIWIWMATMATNMEEWNLQTHLVRRHNKRPTHAQPWVRWPTQWQGRHWNVDIWEQWAFLQLVCTGNTRNVYKQICCGGEFWAFWVQRKIMYLVPGTCTGYLE